MSDTGDRFPVVLMATLPRLAMNLGLTFLRFQSHRKRGVRRFRDALEAGGMPHREAALLARSYHEAGSLREMLRGSSP
ncbi:MAG TPA: hypothetical protein VF992_06340 [Thermoplasmata archaeon]